MSSIEVDRAAVGVALMCIGVAFALGFTTLPIAVVAATLACLAAISIWKPVGALVAVAATLPWFYHPIAVGVQHFAASELLLVVAVVGFAARLGYELLAGHRRVSILNDLVRPLLSPLHVTLAVLAVTGALLSLLLVDSAHRAESLREWRWTLLEPLAFIILLALSSARDRTGDRILVAAGLIVGGVAAALQAFTDLVGSGGIDVEGVTRITGPYPHPNALALMEARLAAFALAWWIYSQRQRIWLLAPSAVMIAAGVATLSRGALIALAVAGLLILPRLPRNVRHGSFLAVVATLAILVAVAPNRMLNLFSGGSGSLRIDIWSAALRMIQDRPIVGYGPDGFLYAYLPRYVEPSAWGERFTSHAHNIVFDFWVRLGIIGLAFSVMVIVACARQVPRLVRGRSDSALRAAAIVGLVASLTHGLIDNAYFTHDLAMSGWLLGWLAFGPTVSDSVEGAGNGARPGNRRRWVYRFPSLR